MVNGTDTERLSVCDMNMRYECVRGLGYLVTDGSNEVLLSLKVEDHAHKLKSRARYEWSSK